MTLKVRGFIGYSHYVNTTSTQPLAPIWKEAVVVFLIVIDLTVGSVVSLDELDTLILAQ